MDSLLVVSLIIGVLLYVRFSIELCKIFLVKLDENLKDNGSGPPTIFDNLITFLIVCCLFFFWPAIFVIVMFCNIFVYIITGKTIGD